MNFWPSRDFLDCLGWTLLHFLWQGLCIAALFAVALRLLRRRSANLRSAAGCLALLLMALAPVATFYSLDQADDTSALKFLVQITPVSDNYTEIPSSSSAPQLISPATAKPSAIKRDYSELLEASLPWLVAAWSLGVLALCCRLFAGWLLLQRLCHTATALTGSLPAKLRELAGRLGVSRPLRLLQSACVEVPTVIGWLRPVILLPASCLTGLTPAQLESILAHELAHIRRHDYLINLLQNLVETLLFYHPAIWWVSRRIREEREHCCDDLAVKICGDAITYARALATLEELRPAPAQLVLAAAGAPLLKRIRRLAGQPERTAVRPAWPVAGIIAILLLAIIAAALRNNPASAQPATNPSTTTSAPTSAVDYLSASGVITWTPTNPVPFVSESKKLPPAANSFIASSNSPLPEINLKTKWVELDASKIGTNTYAWLLGDAELQKLTNLLATFTFSDFLTIRPTDPAEPEYQILLHTNSYNAPLSAVLSEAQIHAAIKKLEEQNGADILTAPEVTTEAGRQAQVQAVDITNLFVGGMPLGSTNRPHIVKNMPFGPVVDFIPRVGADGHSVQLTVIGTITEFVGYEDPATVTNRNGKPMPKNWAIPHLRLRQFTADVLVGDGQTLVIGGARTPLTTIQQIKQKVPLLGDIPLLGHLFRSSKATTNTVQRVLMLLVTPTLINPDGTRYHFPDEPPKGRQAIIEKLKTIRVPEIKYDHLPLAEVINHLTTLAKTLDPEKTGINFFISREPITDAGFDVGSVTITIGHALKDVHLSDVLDAITKTADKPIKYAVLDYAIVFSLRGPDTVPLEIRTYHIDPNKFSEMLDDTFEGKKPVTRACT